MNRHGGASSTTICLESLVWGHLITTRGYRAGDLTNMAARLWMWPDPATVTSGTGWESGRRDNIVAQRRREINVPPISETSKLPNAWVSAEFQIHSAPAGGRRWKR